MDPDVSKCFGTQETIKEATDGFRGRKMWLSLNQMAGPMFWNSEEDAKLIAADSPSRPHSSPSMAKAGKLEYYVEITEEMWERLNKDKVTLTAQADVKPEDYKKIKASMDSDSNPTPKKPKTKPNPEDMTEEERAKFEAERERGEASKALATSLGALKRLAEKARKDTDAATANAIKLTDKGYPSEMVKFFTSEFEPMSADIASALEFWAKMAKFNKATATTVELNTEKAEIDERASDLDTKLKSLEPKMKE
eukprot:9118048-Alexandrium_andersonii.AAC.1